MKKGFTLVELLAAIVIVGVIAGIAISLVSDSIKSSREKISDEQKVLIEEACKNYMAKNVFNSNNLTEITVSDLASEGFIDDANLDSQYKNLTIKIEYKNDQFLRCKIEEDQND